MSEPYVTRTLTGWGRMAPATCRVYRPEKRRALSRLLKEAGTSSFIPRGMGRSYGDAAVNADAAAIDMTRLNRMLDFDPESGELECEAGVTLAEIIACFLPRGYFLPVTPGTKFVTVGGAIANDIHGKNHHKVGSFGNFVRGIDLLLPSGEVLHCAPDRYSDIFWATVGGIGLTGVILAARIQLVPVPSAYLSVDYHRAPDLDDALATMAGSDARYSYSVAWIDCLASGSSLGRSVLMRGDFAKPKQLAAGRKDRPYEPPHKTAKAVPFDFPAFVLNPVTVRLFNGWVYGSHKSAEGVIVDYNSYFYPLDTIHHWNRLYGKNGFAQYQATFPAEQSEGIVKLLETLSASGRPSFLAVLKRFGEGNASYLSHPMAGYTLSLDIPNHRGLIQFLQELDAIVLEHGGRLYCGKDVATSAETFAQMYPRLEEFKAVKQRIDPENTLSSSMARRLEIVP